MDIFASLFSESTYESCRPAFFEGFLILGGILPVGVLAIPPAKSNSALLLKWVPRVRILALACFGVAALQITMGTIDALWARVVCLSSAWVFLLAILPIVIKLGLRDYGTWCIDFEATILREIHQADELLKAKAIQPIQVPAPISPYDRVATLIERSPDTWDAFDENGVFLMSVSDSGAQSLRARMK